MTYRTELEQEFITLRNQEMHRPKSSTNKRLWNIYLDYIIESDELAKMKTDEQLIKAIERFKES